jgi:hypothetical protein
LRCKSQPARHRNPARAYRLSFEGSLLFSKDFVVFIVADEFESCFYELAVFLF